MRWTFLGIEFHRRYREGRTYLDLSHCHMLDHWGWFSLEWARGPHVDYYRAVRAAHR